VGFVFCWLLGHDTVKTAHNPNPLCHRCHRRFDVSDNRGWFKVDS
jgi:hypothetical protein